MTLTNDVAEFSGVVRLTSADVTGTLDTDETGPLMHTDMIQTPKSIENIGNEFIGPKCFSNKYIIRKFLCVIPSDLIGRPMKY